MAKWGLWAAHRYLYPGASEPRTVGVDGRLLQRPWRVRSERVVAEARWRRASRPQSRLPRMMGWLCIGIACVAALMPVGPLPSHVPVSAASGPVPEPVRRAVVLPAPEVDPEQGTFCWAAAAQRGRYELVLLGEDYRELARLDATDAAPFRAPEAFAQALDAGRRYHAYVRVGRDARALRSELVTFVWR